MRGGDERALFSYVHLEGRVCKDHPRLTIRGNLIQALSTLSGEFSALYSLSGRPSIAPAVLVASFLFDPLGASVDGGAFNAGE